MPYLLDDVPENQSDRLWEAIDELSNSLASILTDIPVTSPILVSGDWGAGKTTLLHAVEAKLEETNRPSVWFDAWAYEGEIALLPALMRTVWEATPKSYRRKQGARGLFAKIWRCAVAVMVRAGAVAAPVVGTALGSPVVGAAVARGASLADLRGEYRTLGGATALDPPADATDILRSSLAQMIEDAWEGEIPVVFVDDLDRCSPEGAVALLDSVRMLVAGAGDLGCRFVAALDRGVVAQAISGKFAGISGYDGNRYLEKIFPISFAVPVPDPRQTAHLMGHFFASVHQNVLDRDQRDALNQALTQPMFSNPRLMKRTINRFLLVAEFERKIVRPGDEEERSIADRALAKWIAAAERWPQLRSMMVQHGNQYWQRFAEALRDPRKDLPGPDAQELLEQHGASAWLRRELPAGSSESVEMLRQADDRLRRWGL